MIDINNLPTPKVLQTLDYETILNENIENFKILVPNWKSLESDEFKLVLEAFAYRELFLRAEFNELAKAFFLSTATGSDLDNYGVFYNVERLQGSKPYANYTFALSGIINQDITIPGGLVLTDITNTYEAKLLEDVVIPAGDISADGVVELQQEITTIDVKTEIITTSLPFVITATATEDFGNGSVTESDENLKERILLSMADKSTAGSEETYISYTFAADERIEDVAVDSSSAGVVDVYYYSSKDDAIMKSRIEAALNAKEVRPLTDQVVVSSASPVNFQITAELKINANQDALAVYANALANLDTGLKSLKKIGVSITLSEINDFLKVSGVKEVVITSPIVNVDILNHQIGNCNAKSITSTII